MPEYIIKNDYKDTFYTSFSTWSKEYPDAHIFDDLRSAQAFVDGMPIGEGVVVIENYGLVNEKEVY